MSKILIIDDDVAICELVKINLELQGYNCIYSTDPIRGFALIKQEEPNRLFLFNRFLLQTIYHIYSVLFF